jgi:hypothetical protein
VNSIPPGFLERDGSVKSIATYPDLAAYLGGAFNRGDEGAGNFRLPEARAEFERGWDHGRGVDVGRAVGSYQLGTVATFDSNSGAGGASVDVVRGTPAQVQADTFNTADYPGVAITYTVTGAGLGAPSDGGVTRPRNVAVVMCIKAWNAPINQGNIDIAALAAIVDALRINGPLVGEARNLRMAVAAASATATITADQLIVEQLGVAQYKLPSLNLSINLASVGAGGMDTGAAPVSGTVGIYVIYNPDTKLAKLLGVNATAAVVPEVYGGGNMPAGYTASALVSVWQTNASGQLVTGFQKGRLISYAARIFLSNGFATALTALSLTGLIPRNAKSVGGYAHLISNGSVAGGSNLTLASDLAGSGQQTVGVGGYVNLGILAPFYDLALSVPLVIYYQAGSSPAATDAYITSYTF